MIEAALWSAAATITLLIGMALAYRNSVGLRGTGLIMAFGAGAIISAVSYSLVLPAAIANRDEPVTLAVAVAIGALTFYAADRWIDGLGGDKRLDFEEASGSGVGILLGSLLDGVPESLVLGLAIAQSSDVSLAFVFAVAISNVPQGLGGTAGMLAAGWKRTQITRLWIAVCSLSVGAAMIGYLLGIWEPGTNGALIDSFAAGALLVMLTDSMIPESFRYGGRETGLALVLGFGAAVGVALLELA